MSFGSQEPKLADSAGLAGEGSAPRRESIFYNSSAAAISDGQLVGIDLRPASGDDLRGTTFGFGASIEVNNGNDDDYNVVGIADQDIPIGSWGRVVTYGVKIAALTNGVAVAAGQGVQGSGSDPGEIESQGGLSGTERVIGFALAASYDGGPGADTACDVFVQLG